MNKAKRNRNRALSEMLRQKARNIELSKHICENCGEPGGHWVATRGFSLEAIMTGLDDQEGFWTCSKYYGEDGRRLPEHTNLAADQNSVGMFTILSSINNFKKQNDARNSN